MAERDTIAISIRHAESTDLPAIVALALSVGLVPEDARTVLEEMLDYAFGPGAAERHRCLVAETDRLAGIAYGRPRELTNGTYDLTMLAVDPTAQRGGVGQALLAGMEDEARALGQRQMLIDTSTDPERAAAHAFYRRCGYAEEARIRDYWDAGDHLVVYRKAL